MLISYDCNELLTVAGRYVYPGRTDRPRKIMHTLTHTLHHNHDLDRSILMKMSFSRSKLFLTTSRILLAGVNLS